MNKLFCENCGSELETASVFCGNCGAPVDEGMQEIGAPSTSCLSAYQNGFVANPTQVSQKKTVWPIFVIIAVVAVAVIIAAVIFAQGDDSEESVDGAAQQTQEQNASVDSDDLEKSSQAANPSTIVSPPEFTRVTTSSVLAPDATTSDYSGINAIDGVLETAWNEGAYGDGTGEWLELSASTPQLVSSVSIAGGYPKLYRDGSDVYYKNNRPRQVTISYDGGAQVVMLQDLRGRFQTFTFAQPVETTFIRITIDSVYKGANYDDCCIAEIKVS